MIHFEKEQIEKILPQSDPILLIDRASVTEGESAESSVFVDPSWDIFRGHFRNHPVLPGIYIAECMAQTADLILLTIPGNAKKFPMFFSISQMRFLRPVYPGSRLDVFAGILCDAGNGMYDCEVSAACQGKKVASGKITLALT